MKYCATCHSAYASNLDSCPADNSVLSSTSELLQGLIIRRRYEILEKVGAGGMAAVYRARHIAFNETRAIKVVRGWLAEDEDFVRRLRAEALIARKLKHPNAVHVDDLDELEDGRPFIVMEYIEGANLRKVIRDEGPLRPARALAIARQVASALGAAHSLNIVHRDIKPDNIVLVQSMNTSEEVKVLDFGIAKIRGGTTAGNFETRAGVVLCTPEYASPEQASGKRAEELDGRSDLYSLGIVLYEMLTGTLPFRSDTPIGMLLAQINTLPRLPSEAKPGIDLPESVSPLLMKALEKDPAKRFQTAEEMLAAIGRVESELAATDPDNVVAMPAREVALSAPEAGNGEYLLRELEGGSHRRTWLYATVIAVLLVGVSLGAWWWKTTQRHSAQASELSTRVQQTLVKNHSEAQLHATVIDGVVVLSGEAKDEGSLEQLAATLAGLEGVFRVDRSNVRISRAITPPPPAPKPSSPTTPNPAAASSPIFVAADAGGVQSTQPKLPEVDKSGAENPPQSSTEDGTAKATRTTDPRIVELLARAKSEHDDGLYDDEIRDYDEVLKLDRNNDNARKGKRRAMKAKQADPGSQP